MKTHLTARFFVLLSVAQLCGVMSLALPWLLTPYLLTWPGLGLLLWLDRRTLAAEGDLTVNLHADPRVDSGQPYPVKVQIVAGALRGGMARGTLFVPQSERVTFERGMADWAVRSHSATGITFSGVACALGYETWDSLELWVRSVVGLWILAGPKPVSRFAFRVFPQRSENVQQAFEEIARHQPVLRQGSRRLMRGRDTGQFHSIRPYVYPDPVRYIDGKKSARYQQLMTRVYDSLQAHHLVIGLDVGRALVGRLSDSAKHDYYVSASLALAEGGIVNHDQVSLCAFSQKAHHVVHSAVRFDAFLPLYRGAPELRAREEESNFDTFAFRLNGLAPQRSLVFLLTDFTKPSVQNSLLATLPSISRKHLVMVATVAERRFDLADSILNFSGELDEKRYGHLLYNYWLDEQTRQFQLRMAKYGVGAVVVHEHDWMDVVKKLYAEMRNSVQI